MWLYNNKEISLIEDMPVGTYGFIYMTTHIPTGVSYIGKKSLFHNVKRKLTKKELAEMPITRGRKVTTEVVQKESDWKIYHGSAKPILELLKAGKQDEFKREILHFVNSKKLLTYYECKYLFKYGVLENPLEYFNDNILGKFYTKDFI
jgi:uncharacterized protein with ParB-like and HNH nuclease domain